jgi:6,7-dimethyl-8-ribityllumazine synthase
MPVSSQEKKQKIIVIESRDYESVADELLRNTILCLKQSGTEHDQVRVMTLSSIPSVLSIAVEFMEYDGAILLGCAIKDGNYGFEYCHNILRSIHEISADLAMPIGLGIITAANESQALQEALSVGNNAANQCLEIMRIRRYFVDNLNEDVYNTFNV